MVHKYIEKETAIEMAKGLAKEIAEDESRANKDVQVVLSNGEYHVESPPVLFIRSWETIIMYLEVSHFSVREKRYE